MSEFIKETLKKTFVYRVYRKRQDKTLAVRKELHKKYFWEENEELLLNFSKALNSENIVFWLEFGTMLGYYREHDFIPHDLDIDMGTFFENAPLVKQTLEKYGFERVRHYWVVDDGGLEECYRYKHSTIDVYYFREDGNIRYCNSFLPQRSMRKKRNLNKIKPAVVKRIEVPKMNYVQVEYKGCKVYVPENPDLYLKTHYGASYMTPNPNYNARTDSTNIIYYPYKEKPGKCLLKVGYYIE